MDSLFTSSAVELAALIRGRQISSRELLEGYLARIERLDGSINSVVTLDADRAREGAIAADAALVRGDDLGPLHGLPITVKDAIETAGIRSTGGAVELRDHVPVIDAPAVARLKQAGAVVFGKTNVPRWSTDIQTFNELFGTTNNPWATERTPGGSSGGAAAAVACGFTSFEVGTDIGGSIRNPAHCCGVFGLKPSYGIVPQRGYLDHLRGGTTNADLNVFGPIARSPDDLHLLLDVLAGPDAEDAVAWRLELPRPRRSALADHRIGLWLDDPACRVDDEYLQLMRRLADALTDEGAHVDDAHPPVELSSHTALFSSLVAAAIAPSMPEEVAEAFAGSHLTWLRNTVERARLRSVWAEWFTAYDVLICPVLATPAFPHDQQGNLFTRTVVINGENRSQGDIIQWVGLITVVNLPAAVVPIGRTSAGVPVGVQVVVPYLHDHRAIHVARLIAQLTGGYQAPPGF
jgi:amidase